MQRSSNTLKILIADDHPLFRDGLKGLLQSFSFINSSIDEAANGAEVIKLINNKAYDCVFLDIIMPVMNGIDTLKKIRTINRDIKVILLSMSTSESTVLEAYRENVDGYLVKNTSRKELEEALTLIMEGEHYYSKEVSDVLLKRLIKKDKKKTENPEEIQIDLTLRESEVLNLICKQYSANDIGERLNISELTVKKHKQNLLIKTKSKNVVGLAVYAITNGLYNAEF